MTEDVQKPTDILDLLRTWDSPVHPDNIRERAAKEIERLRAMLTAANAACLDYEEGEFVDPGRAMDAVRDALGRRGHD